MRTVKSLLLVLVWVSTGAASASETVSIPVIHMPYGAKLNTEVMLTDNDLLGVVKEGIPAFVQLMGTLGGPQGIPAETLNAMQAGTRAAMAGVRAVRFLAAQYPAGLNAATLAEQLNIEAKKSGKFTRIISRVSEKDMVVAVYAEAERGGYLGYYYDVKARSMMAGRIVGFLDADKLVGAAIQMIGSMGFGGLGSVLGPATMPPDGDGVFGPDTDNGTYAPDDENSGDVPIMDNGSEIETTDGAEDETPLGETEATE